MQRLASRGPPDDSKNNSAKRRKSSPGLKTGLTAYFTADYILCRFSARAPPGNCSAAGIEFLSTTYNLCALPIRSGEFRMRSRLIILGLSAYSLILLPSSASAGWGHGPSWSQARKIAGQAAKDFHNGISSIHVGSGPARAPAAGMRWDGDGVSEHTGGARMLAPAITLVRPRPEGPVLENAHGPGEPICPLDCQALKFDNPWENWPDPREEKSAEPRPAAQTSSEAIP